jgi:hypothetical protein
VTTSRPSHPFRIAAIALLLALVAIALPLKTGQPRHLHQATSAGLYNEEHVLASLEFLGGDVPLPDGPPTDFVALVVVPCSAGPAEGHADPVVSLADSRAPPRLA